MPDDKHVILVPVDPEIYGLGMAIGCLLKFWPVFVVIGTIIFGVYFLWRVGFAVVSYPENMRQTSVAATSAVVYRATQTTRHAKLEISIGNMQRYRGQVSPKNNRAAKDDQYFKIRSLIFAGDGIRVDFESETSTGGWYNAPDRSCIFMQSNNSVGGRPIANEITSKRLGDTSSIESGITVYHYEGFLLFPYTVLPNNVNQLGTDTAVYFNYGCGASNPPIVLFDILDFSQ